MMIPVPLPTRWNDLASTAALTLGADAGRKEEFLLCVTLPSEGRKWTHKTEATIQNATIA
jgi:hypothetical protein